MKWTSEGLVNHLSFCTSPAVKSRERILNTSLPTWNSDVQFHDMPFMFSKAVLWYTCSWKNQSVYLIGPMANRSNYHDGDAINRVVGLVLFISSFSTVAPSNIYFHHGILGGLAWGTKYFCYIVLWQKCWWVIKNNFLLLQLDLIYHDSWIFIAFVSFEQEKLLCLRNMLLYW